MSRHKRVNRYYERCAILDCDNPVKARGLCDNHYHQCLRAGVMPETRWYGYAGTPEEIREDIQRQLETKSHLSRRGRRLRPVQE